jgi:N-methylhydantoinase A
LEKLAVEIKALGVQSLAIFFMNSYINPAHEEAAAEKLREWLPDTYVTFSTDLTREWYEYERCSTAAANAYVGPQVSSYIGQLDQDLKSQGFNGALFMMGSNGGLLSAERTCRQPIGLVESGPIGGCIGASAYAEKLGFNNVVAFDMGGTTAKCALVENGRFSVNSVYYANGYVKGFPIKSAVIDIVEVGSGGGSIAWIDSQKRLHVGPQSAGSTPGPVSYGRGGTEPTVTDANLVLGRIPPHLLGGEVPLDPGAARAGLEALGSKLGLDLPAVAAGVLEIAAWNQANALRQVTVQRGLDVRDFVLATFGGSGSLAVCRLLELLGLPGAVVPRDPGNLSAFGLLTVDVKNDEVQTAVARHADLDPAAVAATLAALEARAARSLDAEGFPRPAHRYLRSADLRYFGQAFEVRVPVPDGPVDHALTEATVAAFHDAHQRLYGYSFRDDPTQQVEWVNLRVSGIGPIRRPDIDRLVPVVARHPQVREVMRERQRALGTRIAGHLAAHADSLTLSFTSLDG